jgi:hypothetical protein
MRTRILATAVGILGVLPVVLGDVFGNARIAQQNLRRIAQAMHIYSNDNQEWFPTDPAWLYPAWVPDAAAFWNPGDQTNRRAPIAISNSGSNMSNSARISYDFLLSSQRAAVDSILLRDNSPRNNGNRFINFITLDGVLETDPPEAAPTPTQFRLARDHLGRLGWMLAYSANDKNCILPLDLHHFWREDGSGLLETTRSFWNPGDSDPLPPAITNSVPNDPQSALVSFDYLTPGENFWTMPPDTVILRDNTAANNAGFGVYAIVGDGGGMHLRFFAECPGDTDLDRDVDPEDLGRLLAHFGRTDDLVTPADGDIDANGRVDMDDAAALLTNYGSSCP